MFILILSVNAANAQKRRRSSSTTAPAKTTPANNIQVHVHFTNGNDVYGRLIDINLKNISIDPGNGKVIIATLQEVASMSIGEAQPKVDAQFLSDADAAIRALAALSVSTDNNIGYSEYQNRLSNTKSIVENFIAKNDRKGPADLINAIRGSMRGFEMVLPVWSLRVGAEQHKYVFDNSEEMRPIFETFPDIKQVIWKQNDRYPIEKVIAWVWVQSSKLVEQSKQQIARLKQW